mmetsp:Transcript_32024/g.34410  ORF Transcript_32024/g.34410 Transcript_32024/m.34410 type:complete len:220 (-) Transcript_32024:7-666(-)
MVNELIILIEACLRKRMSSSSVGVTKSNSSNNNNNNYDNDDDEDLTAMIRHNHEIRRGITDTILQMNRLVLERVEDWTRRWIEINPLMASPPITEDDDEKEPELNNSHSPNYNQNYTQNADGRPINFRRRILDNLPLGSRQLYELLEGRLTVHRDEWYRAFGGSVEDFTMSVWTLRKCGLIRPKQVIRHNTKKQQQKTTHRQQQHKEVVAYEKVAVVWC